MSETDRERQAVKLLAKEQASDSRILVVDDTDAQRYAIARILSSAGYTVFEAGSGAETYRLLASEKPDLVILDVNLPDTNGFDICRKIKSSPETESVAVLQMSASFVSVLDRVHGLEGGADAYLTPPLESTELLATVNALLRMRRAEERARLEARQAEHARAELSAVLASVAEGIAQLDVEGRIVYLNAAGERMLGASSDSLRGVEWHKLIHGRENIGAECEDEQCGVAGHASVKKNTSAEATFQREDGSSFTVEYTAAPLVEDGVRTGAVISFRDVSERKRSEEVLRITEKLATTGRMAATMAHEINNPLEAVTNLLYLMEHHPNLDPKLKNYTQIAQLELSRVAHITRQTLAFYRHTSAPTEINVVQALEEVLAVYSRRVEGGAVTVLRKYEYEEPVEGFAGELRQVFSNLIMNALEAIGSNGRIGIHVYPWRDFRGEDQERGVRVTISDNGPGIRPEQREHIFEPFFTTKGEKGTGLGLWVSDGIVRKHGGSIRMRSRVERPSGTVFSVFLPRHAQAGIELTPEPYPRFQPRLI